ncbi:MAG: hypothetical protein ACK55O_13305 [Phycisphaerales bacterium]
MTTHALAASPLNLRQTRDSSTQPVGAPPREQAAGGTGASLRLATMPSTTLRAIESAYIRCAGVISRALMVRLGGDAAATEDLMQQLWIAAQTNATVTDEGNGQYLLTATPPRLPTDPVTTDAKMMSSYKEGEGVRWVRMTFNDPAGRGSMTIAPLVGVIDPARLDKANAVPQGAPAPMPIDAGMLMGLLGG